MTVDIGDSSKKELQLDRESQIEQSVERTALEMHERHLQLWTERAKREIAVYS